MRILQVITDTDRRGAQVFATDLHRSLVNRGHDVTTVALAPGTADDLLKVPVLGRSRRSPATIRSLRRMVRTVDVVAAHGSTTLPACAIATRGTSTPFVYRQISDSLFWASSAARRFRVRAALARATRVVALSASAAGVLRESFGVPADHVTVIPNGVPAAMFAPGSDADRRAARDHFGLAPDAFVVLSISALVPEKGVDLVIDAVVGSGDGDAGLLQLLVVGSGPERSALDAHAAAAGGGTVNFAGAVDDARPAYLACDVVMLASRGGDSMPATLIEAALCGRPAIATPVGAITDIVRDGHTGLIVPIDDSAALAEAIASLRDDPDRCIRLGTAAREHALEQFDLEVVAAAWESVLALATGPVT